MVNYILFKDQQGYYTNQDGDVLFDFINSNFKQGNKVNISFKNISGLNSSFVNSAFIRLLDYYTFDFIKSHLGFTDSNKQINNLILSRFHFEAKRACLVN
jgi:hypothetical protein